jgi:ankyrin repeat protein
MNDTKLIDAVKAGDYDEADRLVKTGADVNQQNDQGWTPLNFAAGKGELPLVRLLVENGADIFKVGRDRRTPYEIALAAGRVSVVKYLREIEDQSPREKPLRPERKYCKAYYLRDLKNYSEWNESRINWKKKVNDNGDGNGHPNDSFPDDKVVFIHQDFTVTESAWHNENVIFNQTNTGWKEFCATTLKFKVPDDLDLIAPNEAENQAD